MLSALILFVAVSAPAEGAHCPATDGKGEWTWTNEEGGYWWRYRRNAALDDLNGQRARRGLPPYAEDPALTQAALAAATFRAEHGIEGHVGGPRGDFGFLPAGASAPCAGCAVWPPSMPFGACAMYENWRYCGAATVCGKDGRNYHHAFYRN